MIIYKDIEFNNTGEQLSDNIIDSLNCFWGGSLPFAYKEFLKNVNGGIPNKDTFIFGDDSSNVDLFFGVTPDKHMNIFKFHNIPKNMIAIGEDAFGNLILLAVTMQDRGKVYFWDHELACEDDEEPGYENLTLIADSFDKFLSMLKSVDDI